MKTSQRIFTYCTLAFFGLFSYENANAMIEGFTENELTYHLSSPLGDYTSGYQLDSVGYDESERLYIKLKYIQQASLHSGLYNNTFTLIPAYGNTARDEFLTFRKSGFPIQQAKFPKLCTGGSLEYYNGQPYCKYTMGTDIIVYVSKIGTLQSSTDYLLKNDIDTYLGLTDALETYNFLDFQLHYLYNSTYGDKLTFYPNTETYYVPEGYNGDSIAFPYEFILEPVDGLCGLDDGTTTNQEPPIPPRTLCQAGTASEVSFNGYRWTWTCYGENGGLDDSCESYNELPINALCGLYDGNYYDEDEPPTTEEDFCEIGYLIFPTFVETPLGWTWTCGGYLQGNNANCVAYKNIGVLPELPEQDDCSLEPLPDKWLCEISNSIKSIFLPDAEKINELQETINRINGRFPFNYLATARTSFEDLQENTENDTIIISLLDNEGTLNLEAVEPIADATKTTTQGLFIFGFMFWSIGYIKHFFN